jgi:uncharacterized protein YgbK (DUF1537 family)
MPLHERAPSEVGTMAVGIVADDLTGGNDSAVQFARDGWRARLILENHLNEVVGARSVLAVVTDSRAMHEPDAKAATASAVMALQRSGVDRLFVKIDSTMRGSINGQIQGALEAWSVQHPGAFAVVCPAYPAMGRTLYRGQVLISGARVETTAMGRDPVTPMRASEATELLPDGVGIALTEGTTTQQARQIETGARNRAGLVIVDASTDADLRAIASAIAHLGPMAVPVGAAGLAAAMSRVWADEAGIDEVQPARLGAKDRVVVVVSSLHSVSRQQCEALVALMPDHEVHRFQPALAQFFSSEDVGVWMSRQLEALPGLPRVVVIAAPDERSRSAETAASRAERSATIASGLATATEVILDRHDVAALVLIGGDGARAVLDRLGGSGMRIMDTIAEGVPFGVVEGGQANGLSVVTKAGGFGGANALIEIVDRLLAPVDPEDVDNGT